MACPIPCVSAISRLSVTVGWGSDRRWEAASSSPRMSLQTCWESQNEALPRVVFWRAEQLEGVPVGSEGAIAGGLLHGNRHQQDQAVYGCMLW